MIEIPRESRNKYEMDHDTGCHIKVRPVGVFWMSDEAGPDAKILRSDGSSVDTDGDHPCGWNENVFSL